MYVRKFARTDTGCSILWSGESLLGCTQVVPSCGQVKAELTCSTHWRDSRQLKISAWMNNIKWGLQLHWWQQRAAESDGDNIEMDLFPAVTNMATYMLIPEQSYHITVLQIIPMKVQVLWCWVIGWVPSQGIILPSSSWLKHSKTTSFGLPDACRWRHSYASKCLGPLVQWHGVTSQKTRTLSNATVRTSHLADPMNHN